MKIQIKKQANTTAGNPVGVFRVHLMCVFVAFFIAGCQENPIECGEGRSIKEEQVSNAKRLVCVRSDGVWDGPLVEYGENKRIVKKQLYVNGIPDGVHEEFYVTGELFSRKKYKMDEVLSTTWFSPDGSVVKKSDAYTEALRLEVGDTKFKEMQAEDRRRTQMVDRMTEELQARSLASLKEHLGLQKNVSKDAACRKAAEKLGKARKVSELVVIHGDARLARCEGIKESQCDYLQGLDRDACKALGL